MNDWKLLVENVAYDGKYRKIVTRTFELPNGYVGDFDVTAFGKDDVAVGVLALTDDNKVVCFQQYRPGPMKALYELPGGGIEPGEEFSIAATRELMEETGYTAELEHIGSYYRDAYMAGRWHMFIGRHATLTDGRELEESEHGDVVLFDIDEFKQILFSGEMTDTTLGYAGLLRLGLL